MGFKTTTKPPTTTTPYTGPPTTPDPSNDHCPKIKVDADPGLTDPGCVPASDPLNKPKSAIEDWFTEELFNNLFFKSNLGLGPHKCLPYSYEAFIIAARYFPKFGNDFAAAFDKNGGFTADQIYKRDVAGFLAHKVQETGENNKWLFTKPDPIKTDDEAMDCYMKGALWTWFEGGPKTNK